MAKKKSWWKRRFTKKKISKEVKGKQPPNPFIKEVSMKGIELDRNEVRRIFHRPFINSYDAIIPYLDKREDILTFAYNQKMPVVDGKKLEEDLKNDTQKSNPHFQILSGLGYVPPEEIDCPHCIGGTVAQCEDCHEGYTNCEACEGNWEQNCIDCNGGGQLDCPDCGADGHVGCDHCDGGENPCVDCEGSGGIASGTDSSDGIVPCPECDGGKQKCEVCDGNSTIVCDSCGGDGYFYCDYCEDGVWYCEDCDQGIWECISCNGDWEEHLCEPCEGNGVWNVENSYKLTTLRNRLLDDLINEEKITNFLQVYLNLVAQGIYLPPSYMSKRKLAEDKRELIKNLKLKIEYYDAFDFNLKNLSLNSYSILIVPEDKGSTLYFITSTKVGGSEQYPTHTQQVRPGLGPNEYGDYPNRSQQSYIKGKSKYGDYLNLSYLKTPKYNERKVMLLRIPWYYKSPPFLNWMDDTPLMEKD